VGGLCRKAFWTYHKGDCAVQASTKKAVVLLSRGQDRHPIIKVLRTSGGSGSDAGGWYNARLERRSGMEEEDGRG
jgi:hypothetical protein